MTPVLLLLALAQPATPVPPPPLQLGFAKRAITPAIARRLRPVRVLRGPVAAPGSFG